MSPPQSPAQALISLPPGFDHLKPLEVVKMGARTSHPNPSLAIVTITIYASWCYVRGAGRDPSPVLVRSESANRECQPSPSTRKCTLSIGLRLLAVPGTASGTASPHQPHQTGTSNTCWAFFSLEIRCSAQYNTESRVGPAAGLGRPALVPGLQGESPMRPGMPIRTSLSRLNPRRKEILLP